MKVKSLFFSLLFASSLAANAQTAAKDVLFTIDDKPYYTDEFSRIYKKNLGLVKDDSQKDLNHYIDLYIGYKLKIAKAYKLGLDQTSKYQAELKSYRLQLAKNYMTDTKVTKELLEEAYARSLKEIDASHILFMVDENASPADTLKAYNKAMAVRKKALAGEDFGKLAMTYSEDPSAKENQGELGYFSVFRMLYPFETGAYNTPKGEVSMPVRSRFGYHLIKVNDVRANRGEVSVAHIMILNPKDPADAPKAEQKIRDIYKKLQQGEDFTVLAMQFSEDKASSEKGGDLTRFGSGQLSSSEFEDAAFALTKENPLSEPIKTQFGWHIIKLHQKHPPKTMVEMEADLESKIKKDDRSKIITHAMNEKIRKMYPFKRNDKLYSAIAKSVTKAYYKKTWKVPANTKPYQGNLFVIKDKEVKGTEFLKFLEEKQKTFTEVKLPLNKVVAMYYEEFVDEQLNLYYNDHLEEQYPEFSYVMDEYRDGLLLFDLMEKEIWQKSKNDTIGLQKFFDANRNNYKWKNRLDVLILSSTKEDVAKKSYKMLKRKKSLDEIKAKFNTETNVDIMDRQGVFEQGSDVLPANVEWKKGVYKVVQKDKYFYTTKVNELLPESLKNLDECKGKVINDYQQYLEENWVNDLKKEFTVKINEPVFAKVKSEIKL